MERWGEKRYHSLDYALRSPVWRKSLQNCIKRWHDLSQPGRHHRRSRMYFLQSHGIRRFPGSSADSISAQLKRGKSDLSTKRPIHSYIAYFQAFTNTYGSISHLEKIYLEAVSDPEVKVLSIATRPDCLGPEVLALLSRSGRSNRFGSNSDFRPFMKRLQKRFEGYPLSIFEQAVQNLHARQIPVIVHTIRIFRARHPK